MIHRKREHSNKVAKCIDFNEGTCNFQDTCWFIHELSINQSIPEFNCNFCNNVFKIKSKLMKHIKIEHKEKVEKCRNEKKKCCRYTSNECWFIHENQRNENNENDTTEIENDMIKNIFGMMKRFESRILHLENKV